jgi:hypothetical protein
MKDFDKKRTVGQNSKIQPAVNLPAKLGVISGQIRGCLPYVFQTPILESAGCDTLLDSGHP